MEEISVRLPMSRYQQLLEHERLYLTQAKGTEAHVCNRVARLYNLRGGKVYTLGKYDAKLWCLHVTPMQDPDAASGASLLIDQTDALNLAVAAYVITGQAWKRSWLVKISANAMEAGRAVRSSQNQKDKDTGGA